MFLFYASPALLRISVSFGISQFVQDGLMSSPEILGGLDSLELRSDVLTSLANVGIEDTSRHRSSDFLEGFSTEKLPQTSGSNFFTCSSLDAKREGPCRTVQSKKFLFFWSRGIVRFYALLQLRTDTDHTTAIAMVVQWVVKYMLRDVLHWHDEEVM